jgi:hypothetical protein
MGSYTLWHGPKADLHKSGLRAFQGGPNKQNLPLFLCLLIRNLMAFWTNIVLLNSNLKSKFIKKEFCEKQGFSGPPAKSSQPRFMLTPPRLANWTHQREDYFEVVGAILGPCQNIK